MAANNMEYPAMDPNLEDELYSYEVAELKRWWGDSRWRYTKRPYTPEQIVSKRGNLKIEYPSNAQSKKLWTILESRFKVSNLRIDANWAARGLYQSRTEMPATRTGVWSRQW